MNFKDFVLRECLSKIILLGEKSFVENLDKIIFEENFEDEIGLANKLLENIQQTVDYTPTQDFDLTANYQTKGLGGDNTKIDSRIVGDMVASLHKKLKRILDEFQHRTNMYAYDEKRRNQLYSIIKNFERNIPTLDMLFQRMPREKNYYIDDRNKSSSF